MRDRGFTLIEIAVAMFIVSLVLGAMMNMLTAQVKNAKDSATNTKMGTIKTALTNFVSRNNRLPCPAIETLPPTDPKYGLEAVTPGTCTGTTSLGTAVRGVLPWTTLGLSSEDASDGYGSRLSYHVTTVATALTASTVAAMTGTMTIHSTAPVAGGLPPTGNQINSCAAIAGDNTCNLNAVVVLVSHGPNTIMAYMPSGLRMVQAPGALEGENADTNLSFVQTGFSDNQANPFDDTVVALSPDNILARLIQDGSIQSARSVTNTQLRAMQDALSADIINAIGLVPLAPTAILNDGWGHPIQYTRSSAVACGFGAAGNAYTLTSLGTDGILGANASGVNDDIVLATPVSQLKANILKLGSLCL